MSFISPLSLKHTLIYHVNKRQECSVEIFFVSFIATVTSLVFTFSATRHKNLAKKITSSFVILTLSVPKFQSLSRCISFSVATELSVQVISGFEPKSHQICHRNQMVK